MNNDELRIAIAKAKEWTRMYGFMDGASLHPVSYWKKPDGFTSVLPDWPNDIAEANELLEEMRKHFHRIEIEMQRDRVDFLAQAGSNERDAWASGKTLAWVISSAWADWKGAK